MKIDGISHSILVFVIDKGVSHVLLGMDHPFVKHWITRRSLLELSNAPVPLAAITRAQNLALEMENIANKSASTPSRAKSLSPEQPNVKPKPIERQDRSPNTSTTSNPFPIMEVLLEDRPEEDSPG